MGATRRATAKAAQTPSVHRPPRLPETLVARERLYATIDKASRLPLTQLIAPAGTGKTVLLSAWASRRIEAGDDVAWLAAHEHSALTARLCEAVGRRSGPILKVLADAHERDVEPTIVVVDDAHLLSRQQLQLLADVLDTQPDSVRLVLASRRDLPVPALDLELTGRATALRVNDLRFTDDEATALVRAHTELATADDISRLLERTAGWAAALVLAARSMNANHEPGSLRPALVTTDQPVLDHLLGEAFTLLNEPARQVLLSTFAEPFTSAARAATLSGNPDAGELLAEVTSSGLLVTAYNTSEEITYRYHPLLVELLRRRVVGNKEDAELVRLAHLRSANHAEGQGLHAAALASAIEARDPALISRLLLDYGPEILSAGDLESVGAGFDALTAEHISDRPWLLGVQALHRRTSGDISGAVMVSARATRAVMAQVDLAELSDDEQALRADSVMSRLWQSRYGWQDADAAIADAHTLIGCDHTDEHPNGHRTRCTFSPARLSWLLVELAAAETWTGDLTSASIHLDEALVSARAAGHHRLVAAGLAHRAVIEFARGDARSAAATAQEVLDQSEIAPISEDYSARAHVVLGLAAYSRLDVDSALKWQENVEGNDVSTTDSVVAALRTLLHASLLIEEGELDLARLALATNPAAAGPLPAFLVRDLCLVRYHCATLVGDTATARSQIEALRSLALDSEAALIEAKFNARGMEPAAAADLLAEAVQNAGEAHPPVVALAEALRAAMLTNAGDARGARSGALAVIDRITPQQMIRALTPAADQPAFFQLIQDIAEDPTAPPYVSVVAEALAGHQARSQAVSHHPLAADSTSVAPASQPEPVVRLSIPARPSRDGVLDGIPVKLTAREADVLGQLALGSSYTEIAKDLYITENTVKTHLASLYRKLGVDKRSAALRVARNVGLLV